MERLSHSSASPASEQGRWDLISPYVTCLRWEQAKGRRDKALAPSSVAQAGVNSATGVRVDVAQDRSARVGSKVTLTHFPMLSSGPRGLRGLGFCWVIGLAIPASPVRSRARTAHLGAPGHPRMPWKVIQSWFQGGQEGDQGEQTVFASRPDQIPGLAPELPGRDQQAPRELRGGEMSQHRRPSFPEAAELYGGGSIFSVSPCPPVQDSLLSLPSDVQDRTILLPSDSRPGQDTSG